MEPTLNGVLGGLEYINSIDISESNKVLSLLYKKPILNLRAIDCGAGIGSTKFLSIFILGVSKELLTKWFKTVDLVD